MVSLALSPSPPRRFPLLFKAWFCWDLAEAAEGALSPGLGMPLEGAVEVLVSFFADDVLPPFGMRLAILELFLEDSDEVSSLGDEVSFEDLPDLPLSSLSLEGAVVLLPFAEDLEYDVEEVFVGATMDAWVLGGGCLAGAGLVGVTPSSPYSDKSSSSCRAISTTEGETLEPARGLISLNFSSIDL